MSTNASSPRISSRLAKKRTTGGESLHKRNSDYEYTPILTNQRSAKKSTPGTPANQKSANKPIEKTPATIHPETLPAANQKTPKKSTKNLSKDGDSSSIPLTEGSSTHANHGNILESINETTKDTITDATPKRKRGRPPKSITMPPTITQGDDKKNVTSEVISPCPRDEGLKVKDSGPLVQQAQSPEWNIKSVLTDGLDQFLVSNSEAKLYADIKSEKDEVLSLCVGILSSRLSSLIPGALVTALDMVTMETGVRCEDLKGGTKVIFGSLPALTDASKILSKLVEENMTPQVKTETVNAYTSASCDPNLSSTHKSLLLDTPSGEEICVSIDTDESAPVCALEPVGVPDLGDTEANIKKNAEEQEINKCLETQDQRPQVTKARRLKRQVVCMHKLSDCEICKFHCDLCQYRSSEVGLRKHKQRMHPTCIFPCKICGMEFGIRYDMRRHRLIHFDLEGHLTPQGRELVEAMPAEQAALLTDITLANLELSFKSVPKKNKQGNVTVACGWCDIQVPLSDMEVHHSSLHQVFSEDTARYPCPECDQVDFFPVVNLEQHLINDHGKDLQQTAELVDDSAVEVRCRLCDASGNIVSTKAHIEEHAMLIRCVQCTHSATDVPSMTAHIDTDHKPEKSPELKKIQHHINPPKESSVLYKCGICEHILKTRASLQMHFKSHEEKAVLTCEICGFETLKRGFLNSHMRQRHTEARDRTCDLCDKVFALRTSLDFHRESVHGIGQKVHTCQVCNKDFTTKRFLQVHLKRTHVGLLRYFCPVCNKGFFDKTRMTQHQQIHLPEAEKIKTFVCTFCGKAFSQKGTLKQHENSHQGIKPYKCSICDKAFCFGSELTKHKQVHNNHRPHVCPYCTKGFKFKYKLTAHLVTHTKQGRFVCEDCGKVYTARASLRKHVCKAKLEQEVKVMRSRSSARMRLGPAVTSSSTVASGTPLYILGGEILATEADQDQSSLVHSVKEEAELYADSTGTAAHAATEGATVMEILAETDSAHMVEVTPESQVATEVMGIVSQSDLDAEGQIMDLSRTAGHGEREDALLMTQPEEASSGILYMCSICNKLFQNQSDVNTHMKLEHGAEAVFGQDQDHNQPKEAAYTVLESVPVFETETETTHLEHTNVESPDNIIESNMETTDIFMQELKVDLSNMEQITTEQHVTSDPQMTS